MNKSQRASERLLRCSLRIRRLRASKELHPKDVRVSFRTPIAMREAKMALIKILISQIGSR